MSAIIRTGIVIHWQEDMPNATSVDYVDLYLIHFPVGFVGNKDDNDLFPKDDNYYCD
jgi:diketogulonate reductase-like aldo/keto reductase